MRGNKANLASEARCGLPRAFYAIPTEEEQEETIAILEQLGRWESVKNNMPRMDDKLPVVTKEPCGLKLACVFREGSDMRELGMANGVDGV